MKIDTLLLAAGSFINKESTRGFNDLPLLLRAILFTFHKKLDFLPKFSIKFRELDDDPAKKCLIQPGWGGNRKIYKNATTL